jgi:hypothetical protein
MFPSVSIWGVILGGLSAMVVGFLWYSPWLFGSAWSKSTGISENEMAKGRAKIVPILVIVSLLTAYVLSLLTVYFQKYTGKGNIMSGVDTALLGFVGLAGTALLAHGLWEPKSRNALYINLGNRLVTLVVMGLIVGAFLGK